jgi:hypothetical protein
MCTVGTVDKSHHIGVSLPCVLLEDHLIRSEILSLPSIEFEVKEMKCSHQCLPLILHCC